MPPLRILELPTIRELEGRLLLNQREPHVVEELAVRGAQTLFGITDNDTLFDVPKHYDDLPEGSPEVERINEEWNKWDAQFETEGLTDDQQMDVLKRLGLDFSDNRGLPLRCTRYMAWVAEAAAKGIAGNLPDKDAAALSRFEDTITLARDNFLAKKRSR